MIDRRSLALLTLGGASLLAGLTGALGLLGLAVAPTAAHLAAAHGLLMALGFLGTMIALERAVALGAGWAYLAPLAAGLAAMALVLGRPDLLAGILFLIGGLIFVAMYVAFDRIEASLHTRVQAAGALAWPAAVLLWLTGSPVSAIVPWLAAFLVLTIAGERLELSRLGRLSPRARLTFIGAAALFCAGVVGSLASPEAGMRLAGIGLVALAAWLASHDLARRTVRMAGVTRYIAVCLLIGYGWLAVAGITWLVFGAGSAWAYDAMLHTLFLGFVISMVFGHAPVIVPSVLRVALPYHPRFYAHLALLHAGLLLRVIGGDLFGARPLWQAGGMLNVLALLLFVASSAIAVVHDLASRRPHPPRRVVGDVQRMQREAIRID